MIESQRLNLRNTIARLLKECNSIRQLKQIQTQIMTSPLFSKSDQSSLISRLLFFCGLSHAGSLTYASRVFHSIKNPNLFIYNVMIRAYASAEIIDSDGPSSFKALLLYKHMLCNAIAPDSITLPFVIKECVRRLDGDMGRCIHGQGLRFGLNGDVFVQNSLIALYYACGSLSDALKMFEEMSRRDVVSWNSMITGCLRCGELDLALGLFGRMGKRNVISWNSMITGFVQGGRPKEALEFFYEMQILGDDRVSPDKITIASVLSACASLGALDHGCWVHNYLVTSGLECDMVIGTALIDMYGKCGIVDRAVEVFKEMPNKDVLSWTAMISVFAHHGKSAEAFDLFKRMVAIGVKPNAGTFVGLLSACVHSGLVEEGRWFFNTMKSVYLMEPQVQHYACLVDVLSRGGLFDEAAGIIRDMPMEPDVFVWGALLGGCQMHGYTELGEKVAERLIDMQPQNHAFYVTLCDIYAKAGRFDDAKITRYLMNGRGIKKLVPGSSMIEVDGVVYEFSVRGSPEVLMEELESILYLLTDGIKPEMELINSID